MTAQENKEIFQEKVAACVKSLQFLMQEDWMNALREESVNDKNIVTFYRKSLLKAQPGIDCCMDERGVRGGKERLKPKFVGGALGWAALFMMFGSSREEALKKTYQLYDRKGWDEIEVHIDDHGCDNEEELNERNQGCGFAGIWKIAAECTRELLKDEIHMKFGNLPDGSEMIDTFREAGALVTPLTGDHKTDEAHVVINLHENMTLNPGNIYEDQPAFSWDAWATIDGQTRSIFNELSEQNLSKYQFTKLQATLHLTTGIILGAVRLGKNRNIVLLEPSS